MQEIGLPFGEWLPDLGENENPGLVEAKNVIPEPGGYRPALSIGEVATSANLGGVFVFTNGQEFRTSNGSWTMLTANADTFAVQGNGASAPVVRSRLGTSQYFAQYDDVIYGFNAPSVGISGAKFTPSTATFSTITPGFSGVSAAQIGRFLVRAQPVASAPFDFGWSAFNNPEDVTVSQTTQAGRATMNNADLGPVVGVVGGRAPMIFQTRGVSRLSYVGPPLVWSTQPISNEFGAFNEYSFQKVGDLVYFFSAAGFCVTNGVSVERLGEGRIDNYIDQFVRNFSFLRSAHVESDGAVYWLFESIEDSDPDIIIGYSYRTGRFFRIIPGPDAITCIAGWTTEKPTAGAAALSATLRRNTRLFVAANQTGFPKAGALIGSTLAAEMTTGYRSLTPGRRVAVNAVEPVYDGSGAKVAINTKATLAGSVTAGTPVATGSEGIAHMRADGRAAAVSVTFDAGASWSEFKGAIVTTEESGAR